MIKSIPTKYKEIKFKSKLEAKWAKWLDGQEIIWSYETEGFDLGNEWYLPDFFLPEMNIILEIKGALQGLEKTNKLAKKIHELNKELQDENTCCLYPKYLLLVGGSPVPFFFLAGYPYNDEVCWKKCPKCGKIFLCLNYQTYNCRVCGHYEDGHIDHFKMLETPIEWEAIESYFLIKKENHQQSFFEDGKFIPKLLAEYIQEKYRFATPGVMTDIYRYREDKGIWTPDGETIIREIASILLNDEEKIGRINEVISCIKNNTYVDRRILGRI